MSKTDCTASGQKKSAPVCLLLFVGFIIGFCVGFGAHDTIHKNLSRAIFGAMPVASEPAVLDYSGTTQIEEHMIEGVVTEEGRTEDEAAQEDGDE